MLSLCIAGKPAKPHAPVQRPRRETGRYTVDAKVPGYHKILIELAFEPIFVREFDGRILEWNRGARELYGFTPEQAVGATSHDLLGTRFPVSRADLEKSLERDKHWRGELIHTSRDGKRITVESAHQLFEQPDGTRLVLEVNRVVHPFRTKFRLLFETMQEGMAYCRMIHDEAGRPVDWLFLEANPALETMFGVQGLAGKRARELFGPALASNPEVLVLYGRVGRTGKPETYEGYIDALGMWVRNRVSSPEPDHVLVVGEDITARKQTETALRWQAELLDRVSDAIVATDPATRISHWNNAAECIYGWTAAEAL